MFENRHYIIFNSSDVGLIDFNEVLETSAETCRFSVDGSKTFVKYEGEMPLSVSLLPEKSVEYSHSEILDILSGPEWSSPIEDLMDGN
jgi:hypothetical protein